MYFSNVDKHKQVIEQAPDYIQHAFTDDYGACKHCPNMKEDGNPAIIEKLYDSQSTV